MTKHKLLAWSVSAAMAAQLITPLPAAAADDVISYSNGYVTTTESGTLVAATYGEDGTLAGVLLFDVSAGEPTEVIVDEGSTLMSGGVVVVAGTTNGGNGVFDKGDKTGDSFKVTGGTLVGFGTTDMQDNPTVSGQGYMSTTTRLTAGTTINVKTSSGYIGIVPEITLSSGLLYVTCPEMTSGSSYSVYSGSVSYSDTDKVLGRNVSGTWYGIYEK